ncbi:MAG: hypothetical protein Ct9H300mP25_01930 [Acidobacteriota bacterium]|nr:MAG: hypothetical protein Ct9H300mP25_01930 [Acidobacteriota bacterium]
MRRKSLLLGRRAYRRGPGIGRRQHVDGVLHAGRQEGLSIKAFSLHSSDFFDPDFLYRVDVTRSICRRAAITKSPIREIWVLGCFFLMEQYSRRRVAFRGGAGDTSDSAVLEARFVE